MKLITKEIEELLKQYPLYSQEETPTEEKKILVKFFLPATGWTWYVSEAEKEENGDYLFFGYVVGMESEWGYFRLSDIQGPFNVRMRINGQEMRVPVTTERDLYFDPCLFGELDL